MQALKLFFSTVILLFLFDLIWIGGLAKNIYIETIGGLLRRSGQSLAPNWVAAISVYFVIAIGIVVFVLPKANGQLLQAFCWGAVFGFVVYGVYDFTNYATLANWPLKITLIDLAWGTLLCGVVSLLVTLIQKKLG